MKASGGDSTPPRVPLALPLGVTGHRAAAIPAEALAPLTERIASAISALEGAARALAAREASHFADCTPTFTMVSPLADGADQIAAEAALDRGFALQAVLPFPRAEHRADFAAPEALSRYDALLDRAATVLELPGERGHLLDAYVMAGRATVAHCDVLIAVWDGLPQRGRGGTGEVVELAMTRGTPVVHVPVDATIPLALLWSAFDPSVITLRSEPTARRSFDEAEIERLLFALLAPPAEPRERGFLANFLTERRRRWRGRLEYPLLLAVAGVAPIGASVLHDERGAEATREEWQRYREACAGPYGVQAALELLEGAYVWSDRLATRYAQTYRSGNVFNFLLAAVAAVIGLSTLVLPFGQLALPAIELLVVLAIIFNTQVGLSREWHRRWLDYRQLAERLRPMRSLKLLGIAAPDAPGSAAYPVARRWIDWYAAGVWRAMACPDGAIGAGDAHSLARAVSGHELAPQIRYHRGSAARMEQFDQRLDRVGTALFVLTILVSVASIVALLVAPAWAARMGNWFTFFSAGLPAVGGALFGIRVQGDFDGSAARSLATAETLEQIATELEADGTGLTRAADLVEQASRSMLADLGEWRLINAQYDLTV